MGHFLNKVLKDIINRWMMINGRRVLYKPGWDCHGLPIEMRALQLADDGPGLAADPLQLRAAAAACAREALAAQKASFERWGVMADWDAPYHTMQPAYEAAELGVLRSLLRQGLVYRGRRPVHWSPATQTALAEAELEYPEGHASTAAYVGFRLLPPRDEAAANIAAAAAGETDEVVVPVWTTTPWTIPANQAVCAHEEIEYTIATVARPAGTATAASALEALETASAEQGMEVARLKREQAAKETIAAAVAELLRRKAAVQAKRDQVGGGIGGGDGLGDSGGAVRLGEGQQLLVATARLEALEAALGVRLHVRRTLRGAELHGYSCAHPLSGRPVPLLCAAHVTDGAGTGLVHTAPAHGPEDFGVGEAHRLPLECAVDETGVFTTAVHEAAPFAGLPVLGEGNGAVLRALRERGALLATERHEHRYPYDWRSKTPVIFRTTPQWFVRLDALQERALRALQAVDMEPPASRARLEAFVKGRKEWCLSRQRSWGVPLPAFYHAETGEALLTDETVAHVQGLVARHGTDVWWRLSEAELLPPSMAKEAHLWRKGSDTLDVWFDSGCSWAAVMPGMRADVYLEGSDQHRGWFQSSLLTRAGVAGEAAADAAGEPCEVQLEAEAAPYAAVVTHGFVLDEAGAKMSKSLGNVITPSQLIEGSASPEGSPAPSETSTEGSAVGAQAPEPEATGSKQRKAKRKKRKAKGQDELQPCGADVLRLWVALSDWRSDVSLGATVLGKAREAHRRIRNSCRFLLGNLHDYEPTATPVPDATLRQYDRYVLHCLAQYCRAVEAAYGVYAFNRVMAAATSLCNDELSANYFVAAKDRLYCQRVDDPSRRAAQAVLHAALDTLVLSTAPVLPFLAEEVHAHRHRPAKASPFHVEWRELGPGDWLSPELACNWRLALAAKAEVSRLHHAAQQEKVLGSLGQTCVEVQASGELLAALRSLGPELNDALGSCAFRLIDAEAAVVENGSPTGGCASQAAQDGVVRGEALVVDPEGGDGAAHPLQLSLHPVDAPKCGRCWRHVPTEALDAGEGVQLSNGWTYRGCICPKSCPT